MLETSMAPHREFLLADTPGQKLFVALRLRPQAEAAAARPNLSVAFVVDTSGSMREVVTEPSEYTGKTTVVEGQEYEIVRGAKSKMDLVIASLQGILNDPSLRPQDRIALVHFDDRADVLVPFTPAQERQTLLQAVESLKNYSGGTHMGAGMREALQLLRQEQGSKRMILLSDGQTFDEDLVVQVTEQLVAEHLPVTVIAVGAEWNEALMTNLADRSQGKLLDVVADIDNPQPPSLRASDLPQEILGDIKSAARQVVTDISLSLRTVKDVKIERITRVAPFQSEVDTLRQPYALGNAEAAEETVFVLEFTLPTRPPARMRLAQLGFSYRVPGANYRGEIPPLDIVVEFTHDSHKAAHIDSSVMQWVQQRNIEMLIKQATSQARSNPEQAAKTMEMARSMTVKLGNSVMTQALDRAINELDSSKTISLATAKTLKIGAKTQTLKQDRGDLPSDEEIRRMTGA